MEILIVLALFAVIVLLAGNFNSSGGKPARTAKQSASYIPNLGVSSSTRPAQTAQGEISDFLARLRQIDDDAVGLMLAVSNLEFQKLARLSPDSVLWFKELDPQHEADLKNLEVALNLKIAAHQAAGEMNKTPQLMVMKHTVRGILDSQITMAAIEMWTQIQQRGSPYLESGIEMAMLFGFDFSDFDKVAAEYFMPSALFEKAKSL